MTPVRRRDLALLAAFFSLLGLFLVAIAAPLTLPVGLLLIGLVAVLLVAAVYLHSTGA